jgi:hypothetical protein
MKSYWNYRVIFDPGSTSYSIHEVYYENDKPCSWSENGICPFGESLEELSEDFEMMKKAFSEPILEIKSDKGREYLDER